MKPIAIQYSLLRIGGVRITYTIKGFFIQGTKHLWNKSLRTLIFSLRFRLRFVNKKPNIDNNVGALV